MIQASPEILLTFAAIIFVSVGFMHLVQKEVTVVKLYILQSVAIVALLLISSFENLSILLIVAILSTIAVKIIIAPYFFFGLINRHQIKLSANTYLNTPYTLMVIAGLVALTQTNFLKPLATLAPLGENLLFISIATILVSLFLSINRKDAMSQMFGVLSLENGIVSFALFAGLEQSPALQLGITVNILIWVVIASVFVSMIFKQFGSLDVSNMKNLTE